MTPDATPRTGRQFLRSRIRELPIMVLAWLLGWPAGRLCPRRFDLVVVIGREDGRFSDNAKYFYLHACAGTEVAPRTVYFLSGERSTVDALRVLGLRALRYPSLRAVWMLLRAALVVADSAEWVRWGRYQLAAGARILQLWHGVPLKRIELAELAARRTAMGRVKGLMHALYVSAFARYPTYDVVTSTSRYLTGVAFAPSFHAHRVVETGYPRNDVLDAALRSRMPEAVWLNTDVAATRRLREFRGRGGRAVLYAPTFRIRGRNPVGSEVLDYKALDAFARDHDLCIMLKLHPLLGGRGRLDGFANVLEYDAVRDVYPVLCETDLLVTDYSSIYFDYLLLDRPMVFFPYDLDEYRSRERGLLFDYADLTPGPKAHTQAALQAAIVDVLDAGRDEYREQRQRVRALAFDEPDAGASGRAWRAAAELLGNGQRGSA